ncbi:AraC family transcriptional regulator [Aquibacillus rhizosphaerae]|uniref:AraC family transcriptional regulator n=1 Tax=Aquibacillus rhizosphaerae TaxID=3051431 RepID=A0ABT7L2R5_9BACI|nr:AraC family transcriptional regulator [Aquibacillus sp. LR5S19]MDL4840164.1 AraC family transcriptional regulator [Aquibacillus sp. LR5S19]
MNGIRRLTLCIDYIEERLDSEINTEDLTAIFCTSKFHLLRTFHMLTGFTLVEYIRNRRLTIAAQELFSQEAKIIDVALKYGYETPESFSKAFQKFHGIRPSEVKKLGKRIKAFPPLSFQIIVKGDEGMDYKIVEKPAFHVIGKGMKVTTRYDENFKRIPEFWQEVNNSETGTLLKNLASSLGMLGICMDFTPDQDSFTYLIGVEKGDHLVPDGMEEKEVPSTTWAVFDVVGSMPDAIQNMTKRIYSEWFPATNYKHAGTAEIEVYPPQKNDPFSVDYKTQIWVPITKG